MIGLYRFIKQTRKPTLVKIAVLSMIVCLFSSFQKVKSSNYYDSAPFRKKDFQNTFHYYRCVGMGKANAADLARDKALFNAKTRLTNAILDCYNNNLEDKSFELSINLLKDVKVVKEVVFPNAGHVNVCWLIIEVRKSEIINTIISEFNKTDQPELKLKQFLRWYKNEMKEKKNADY